MKTAYYTLTARGIVAEGELEQAAGGSRRVLLVRAPEAAPRRSAGGNVVDFAAWKAERETPEAGPEPERAPAPKRPGRAERRDRALFAGEALATLAVLCVAAALLFRILAG